MQDRPSPPWWLELVTFGALGALLYYPIHLPYQNPDQDYPAGIALLELVRGGWEPWSLMYPSALTNLMHAGYDVLLVGARLAGRPLDAIGLCATFMHDPTPFRIAPRLVAMTGGAVSLIAVARVTSLVTDRWSGLIAAALLGTSYMFVREHHHGMFDAPAATAVIVSLWFSGCYVVRPTVGALVGATVGAALALSSKWNAAVAGCAPILAFLLAPPPPSGRTRACAIAMAAGVFAVLIACPVVLLDPGRVARHLRDVFEFFEKLGNVVRRQGGPLYTFGDVMRNGLGICLSLATVVGTLALIGRRARPLYPLAAFTWLYAYIVWRSPLPINRYTLPLAAPVAVLAAYGLHQIRPLPLRLSAAAVLVALGLPACIAYDRLLAREDTRVTAARWLRANVRPDAVVFLPGSILLPGYLGPDLPRPTFDPHVLPPERAAALTARMDPPFPRRRFFVPPAHYDERPAGRERLAPWSNSVVVTSELYDGPFAKESTAPELVSELERHGVLLADYPVIAAEGTRTYEPEMNFVPMRGIATLARPGPRLRIWYVPRIAPGAEPSPFLDGHEPGGSESTRGVRFE